MDKKMSFEQKFSECQADMVSVCLEYANGGAEKLYIFCYCEDNMISCDFCYKINGKMYERHEAGKIFWENFDNSLESQVLGYINDNIIEIYELCEKEKREMPTLMELEYDVKTHKFSCECSYDECIPENSEMIAQDVADAWFEDIKQREEQQE